MRHTLEECLFGDCVVHTEDGFVYSGFIISYSPYSTKGVIGKVGRRNRLMMIGRDHRSFVVYDADYITFHTKLKSLDKDKLEKYCQHYVYNYVQQLHRDNPGCYMPTCFYLSYKKEKDRVLIRTTCKEFEVPLDESVTITQEIC